MIEFDHEAQIIVDREESNFDRACDSAYVMAVGMFGIDEDGHSSRINGWERSSCWIEVVFDSYVRHGSRHMYGFLAYPRKAEPDGE